MARLRILLEIVFLRPNYQREDIRELIERPYRIVYLIIMDRIEILTVRDTRRVLPRRLDEL